MSEELVKQQEARIQELTNEVAALKAKAEEDKTSTAFREAVTVAQTRPAPAPNVSTQSMQRQQAVAACGGNSFWAVLPLDKKLAALGHLPATSADVETAKKLFGPNSSSLEAA